MPRLVSPLWRFAVTDLAGTPLTFLDYIASDRVITPRLSEPLDVTGTVPSDNTEINRIADDGFPFLAEGVRQLYCFRRESDVIPYYTIRASTLVLQVQDAAAQDDARTRFTAWDPWKYLFYRPVLRPDFGGLIGPDGLTYQTSTTADEIVLDILYNMTADSFGGIAPEASWAGFIDYGQTAFYTGTIETCATFSNPWIIQQGTSVGQALLDIASAGVLDIWMEPIYDPINRPGILCQMSIFAQASGETFGMGGYNYSTLFSWDKPGRSLVGADNLYDGTYRANVVQFYNGPGGPPVNAVTAGDSIAIYGEYWAQQFFPAKTYREPVEVIALEQLYLRADYKETLTVNPAPDRAPDPFVDYFIGDGVQVFVSDRMRQELLGWQRVYGIPIELDDNGTETVRELLVGPIGAPPPVGDLDTGAPQVNSQVAVTTARNVRRGGRIGT